MFIYSIVIIKKLNSTTELISKLGKSYKFKLYSFDDFDDLKGFFDEDPALYLFTIRYLKDGKYYHSYIYLGETCNLKTRFDNHHKENCVKKYGANCIGVYRFGGTEKVRRASEKELLDNIVFPCNTQNN